MKRHRQVSRGSCLGGKCPNTSALTCIRKTTELHYCYQSRARIRMVDARTLTDIIDWVTTRILTTHTHTHVFITLRGSRKLHLATCSTSQLPITSHITRLHKFLPRNHTMHTQRLHTRLPHKLVKWRWSEDLGNILDLHHWPPHHSFARTLQLRGSRKSNLTTSHNLATPRIRSCTNLSSRLHERKSTYKHIYRI